jgi:hypothetical protein
VPVNIAELERRARRLLTPEFYDYYAGGVGSERTLRAYARAWQKYEACILTGIAGVTGPTTAHSLDT